MRVAVQRAGAICPGATCAGAICAGIRDQQLTVINPMPGTPAFRAGVKKYDRIMKIGGESTLNMGLNEAVQHLLTDDTFYGFKSAS